MNTLAIILLGVSLVVFILVAMNVQTTKVNLLGLGLACYVAHHLISHRRGAMSHDPHQLVGVPYTLWGESPEVGFDCWTLVGYVRREYFGLKDALHRAAGPSRRPRPCARSGQNRDGPMWKSVAWPGAPGDVVGMSLDKGGWLHHVGVILERRRTCTRGAATR